jgi:FecR protein
VRLAEMPAVAEIQREKPRPLEIKPNACGKKRGLTSSAGANNWIRTDDLLIKAAVALSDNRAPLSPMRAQDWSKLFLCCALALSFFACQEGVTRQTMATVLSVNGTADVRQKGDSEFHEITTASLLGVGALIRTGTGGTLKLAFLPNTLADLSETTELQIDELTLTKDGNATRNDVRSRVVRLRLLRGTMQASFNRLPGSKSDLAIITPHGELSASSDSIFFVNVDDRRTRVVCVYGMITVRVEPTDFSIEAGYFQEFPSGQLLPRAAEDDGQAQREVTSTIDADHALQDLAGRQRLSRPNFINR